MRPTPCASSRSLPARFRAAAALLAALAITAVPAGCARRGGAPAPAPAEVPGLPVPHAVIVRPSGGLGDVPVVRPYERLLGAMGVGTRALALADLGHERLAARLLVLVVPADAARAAGAADRDRLLGLVDAGAILITETVTGLAAAVGVAAGPELEVRRCEEVAYPGIAVTWSEAARAASLVPPAGAVTLTREKESGAALAVQVPRGRGRVVVLATALDVPDGRGYGRYPFVPQVLLDAGLVLPLASPRLAAFFDAGYREGADLDGLARRWREMGVSALHVGAWDYWDPSPDTDDYLRRLLAAAHAQGILVYAWLELPHVSTDFWKRHPEWREKTARLGDAQLDWRYLMNLENPDCARAVKAGIVRLVERFDWDGVNLSELYFDSPMGPSDPAQLTPFNADVRREYERKEGIDPLVLFDPGSPHYWKKDAAAWSRFVDWRVELERALNEEYLALLVGLRASSRPDLGLTLTYVDNLYDPSMREAVGADVRVILPLLDRYDFTLVIEDPMTTWHLGPERYSELAQGYARLTRDTGRLGIDINIVDRPPPISPTSRQTGGELVELLHHAGRSFDTVMVYAESTIQEHDVPLVASSLAADVQAEPTATGLALASSHPLVYRAGDLAGRAVRVDGREWPAAGRGGIWLPPGRHVVALAEAPSGSAAAAGERPRMVYASVLLRDARWVPAGIEIVYEADARGYVLFDRPPTGAEVDGRPVPVTPALARVTVPRGKHTLLARFAP